MADRESYDGRTLKELVLRINAGAQVRMPYQPGSADDALYVMRRLQELLPDGPGGPVHVQVWIEELYAHAG